ncbi:MAG: hypothetical protein KAH24_08060, partial [Holophagae bacterium]|nr:hypothetical protein [Holophagae bacterium]
EVLEGKGIPIQPFDIANTREPGLFVIGNAIARGNVEVEEILNERKKFCSLPELLRDVFIENRKLVMVTGTHGKTTTTALILHILKENGLNPSGMMGGVQQGQRKGFEWSPGSELFVMEGDEYDTAFFDKSSKFLKFSSDFLVINSIEFDHADIFDSVVDIEKAFRFLLRRTPGNAVVFANGDDKRVMALKPHSHSSFRSYGFGRSNGSRILSVRYNGGKMKLELEIENERISLVSTLPGRHNAMNIAAACSVCFEMGISMEGLQKAVSNFPGVRRRFEQRAFSEARRVRVIDDFAHHPTAVAATIQGARDSFPDSRIVAFFEPASNTMRRGEMRSQLLTALELADIAFIFPVPESRRELAQDFEAVSVGKLAETITGLNIEMDMKSFLRRIVQSGDVLLFMSNGSCQGAVEKAISIVNGDSERQTR